MELIIRSQKSKQQRNMRNLFKVTNKVMDAALMSFFVNFELFNCKMFLLLTLNKQMPEEYPQNTSQFVLVSFYNVEFYVLS